jgi:aspartate aminotransferase
MPSISKRGAAFPPSPIRKLVPFAEDAKDRGVHVFHLNIGQPDIATPPVALEAVKNIDFDVLEYSHSAGNESYRKKLALKYEEMNISLNSEELIITTGGSEAILFGMMACLNPDDEVIIPEPFYANYNGYAVASLAKIVPITATIDNGFKLPPIEDFEKKITPKTKAILICNPNNPTGYLYSKEEMNTLKEICLKHDLFLFSDEAYREFAYDRERATSALELDGMEQHTIMIDTISKRYSACGARIGAIVSKNKEVMAAALKLAQARLSPPSLAQIVGETALDVPPSYFNDVKEEYKKRRDTLINRLKKIEGVVCNTPGGAFYAMAQLPVDNAEDFCQWLLEKFSYQGKTIMMAPAAGFYATEGLGQSEVRFAYVLNTTEINSAMDCLEEGLKQYNSK